MKGKQLTIQEVARLDNGTKVYVENRLTKKVAVELIQKSTYSPNVRTVSVVNGEDDYRSLTDRNDYYEYVQGTNVGEVPEITFDSIRYAVAHCKFLNDQSKKIHGVSLFPGIEEAYQILNNIATKNSLPEVRE